MGTVGIPRGRRSGVRPLLSHLEWYGPACRLLSPLKHRAREKAPGRSPAPESKPLSDQWRRINPPSQKVQNVVVGIDCVVWLSPVVRAVMMAVAAATPSTINTVRRTLPPPPAPPPVPR